MYITIFQARNIAVQAIQQLPETEENIQAITRLSNLKKRDFYTNWTKELVFKRLNEWKKIHKRNPTVTNLTEPDMPGTYQIQRLFDMKATAFLNIYYPKDSRRKGATTPYTARSKEEYIRLFVEEYNRIKPKTNREYNNLRNPDNPAWQTIAKYAGVTTWRELLEITKVDISSTARMKKTVRSLNITRQVELYDTLESYLREAEK